MDDFEAFGDRAVTRGDVSTQIKRLQRAGNTMESTRLAGITKEAAILQVMAADLLAQAQDLAATRVRTSMEAFTAATNQATAATDKHSRAMFWLTIVLAIAAIASAGAAAVQALSPPQVVVVTAPK